jgi:hypothetical protein
MAWSSRRLSNTERQELIAVEANRRQVTRTQMERLARSERGLTLPGGKRLILDGSYRLLTPGKAR